MSEQERVFNTFRRKVFRPFYSIREFRTGIVILLILAAATYWVALRGANPDPQLFMTQDKLLSSRGAGIPVYEKPLQRLDEQTAQGSASPTAPAAAANPLEPFPSGVVSSDWTAAGAVQFFDETTLSNKIDGRESFYKSFGFKKLYFLSLQSASKADLSIDIELFDLGSVQNTLGALSAELSSPDVSVTLQNDGLSYLTSNGGFLAQGRYYARMIGSEDADPVRIKIKSIRDSMASQFPTEKLPWTYALFVGGMGAAPGQIRYQKENAFSFGFASDVYSAVIPGSKETEVFLSKRASKQDAAKLAEQFAGGFGSYGSAMKAPPAGHSSAKLFNNEFIHTVEGVEAYNSFVIGIRFAKSGDDAVHWLEKLKTALQGMDRIEAGG